MNGRYTMELTMRRMERVWVHSPVNIRYSGVRKVFLLHCANKVVEGSCMAFVCIRKSHLMEYMVA